MPSSKKSMSKTRQLSALVNFVTVADDSRDAAPSDRDVVGAGDAVHSSTRSRHGPGLQ